MKHRGNFINKKIKESGMAYKSICQQLGKTRGTLHNWLNDENLPLEKMVAIAKIIKIDISKSLAEFAEEEIKEVPRNMSVLDRNENETKNKYVELLESYHTLHGKYMAVEEELSEYKNGTKTAQ